MVEGEDDGALLVVGAADGGTRGDDVGVSVGVV